MNARVGTFIILFHVFLVSFASGLLADDSIPSGLKEWVPLVKSQNPEWACPRVKADSDPKSGGSLLYECTWAGAIDLQIKADALSFTIKGDLYKASSVDLPLVGNVKPSDITIRRNGSEYSNFSFSLEGNSLKVHLPEGSYEILGKIFWPSIPKQISLPDSFALVRYALDADISDIKALRTTAGISLEAVGEVESSDTLKVQVYRTLIDGSPMFLDTRILLKVSGKPRNIDFGSVLPDAVKVVKIDSPLSVSLTDNLLRAQVYQGDYEIRIESIVPHPAKEIRVEKSSNENWPQEELWSWIPDLEFRLVELKNVANVNRNQVTLPPDWNPENLMSVTSGSSIELLEIRRGQEVFQKDVVNLNRTFWPKIDQSTFTVADSFSGTLNSKSRLNALSELHLGSAKINNSDAPVTLDPEDETKKGVELREQSLQVQTVSELPYSSSFAASGWETTVDHLSITLMIPPSWKLLHADNASSVTGSWSSLWTIFDVFILLVLTFFTASILNLRVALLLLVFLVLSKGEFLRPYVFFAYIVFFLACYKATSDTSGRKVFEYLKSISLIGAVASFLAFAVQTLSFAKLQFIQTVFPQLQAGTRFRTIFQEFLTVLDSAPEVWPLFLLCLFIGFFLLRWAVRGERMAQKVSRLIVAGILFVISTSMLFSVGAFFTVFQRGSYYNSSDYAQIAQPAPAYMDSAYEAASAVGYANRSLVGSSKMVKKQETSREISYQNRVLQSGPSLPTWQWRSAMIHFSGPIDADHQVHLYLIPSSVERVLCFFRFLLCLFLLLVTAKNLFEVIQIKQVSSLFSSLRKGAAAAIVVIPLFLNSGVVRADYPDKENLELLKNYLESKQCQERSCAQIDTLRLELKKDSFHMQFTAFSNGESEVVVPGSISELVPLDVVVNGKSSSVVRASNGFMGVKTSAGLNRIDISGRLAEKDILNISFRHKPLRFVFVSSEWNSNYNNQSGEVPEVVRVTRAIKEQLASSGATAHGKGKSNNQLDTWFMVSRDIVISDYITVQGTVSRIGSLEKALSVKIPLLENEKLLSSDVFAEQGASGYDEMLIQFPQGVSSVSFSSSLKMLEEIRVKANAESNVSELWNVTCVDYLNCSFKGIAPVYLHKDGRLKPSFKPLPGEELVISPKVLLNAKGNFITVESISHSVVWGEKVLSGTISFDIKATKQSNFTVEFFDENIEVRSVAINHANDSRKFDRIVTAHVPAGSQVVVIEYEKKFEPGFFEKAPKIKISESAGNVTTIVTPSANRWIVWLAGSYWGPAVLFWAKWFVLLAIMCVLIRVHVLRISYVSGLALSFGLSFLPTIVQFIPLLWLYLVQNVRIRDYVGEKLYKILLILIALFSVGVFYDVIKMGLLYAPPVLIAGNGSSAFNLKWFDDYIGSAGVSVSDVFLPQPYIFSASMYVWRVITLVLSLFILAYVLKLLKKSIDILKED